MFMLPMLGAMALPNISRPGVVFGFVPGCLAHVFRPIPPLRMWLLPFSTGLVCTLLLVRALFAPFLRPTCLVSVRVLLRR
jgi:hypothetical protein